MVTAVHDSDLSPKHVDAYLFVSCTIMSRTDEVKNKKKISFTNDGMVMHGPPLPVNACLSGHTGCGPVDVGRAVR